MNLNATILGRAIAFVLFVLFCMKYVWPPLMAAIEKRQKEIVDGLASAERAHKDLDLAKASATDQLKKRKRKPGNHRAGEQTPLADSGRSES